ncbi:MAG: hypothetical protein SGPRY_000153 [Prymnesium sp.]
MSKWIEEELEPGLRASYGLRRVLNSCTSKWQSVDVVELECFGRTLMIDGLIQSCQIDEHIYHESLVHPAMLRHPCPKRVYIGGGGEGSTAREVLRHTSVEKCVMVDIDGDVVRFCKEALPENAEAFADPRLELVLTFHTSESARQIIDDAKAVLEKGGTYDVIIMDLDDPLEGGPCYQLYTTEFYQMIKSKLNPGKFSEPYHLYPSAHPHSCHDPFLYLSPTSTPQLFLVTNLKRGHALLLHLSGGVFVTQSGQAGSKRHHLVWSPVHSTLRTVFPAVHSYKQVCNHYPSGRAGVLWWSPQLRDGAKLVDISSLACAQVDAEISKRIKGELKFLDGESYRGLFCLSKAHRQTLASETRVLSTEKGTFATMHSQGLCVATQK